MARVTITAKTPLGSYPTLPLVADSADFTFTACDVANGNQVAHNGNILLLVQNVNIAAQTLTIGSLADPYKRTGDITTYSVGASEFAVLGPFKVEGWKQADGYLYINAQSADIKIAAMALP